MSDTPSFSLSPSADASLAQRAEQFDLLVERASDYAIILLDPEGNVVTWNEGARRCLGYEEAEIVGQHFRRFFLPEDREQGIPEGLLQTAREQDRVDNERWHVRKDGTRFYASGVDQALTDDAGNLRGHSVLFRDQTKQHQVEEALRFNEERFRNIVESVTEYAIFTLDREGHVADWNSGAERLLGYTEDEVIGQRCNIFFTPEDQQQGEPEKERASAAATGRAEDERWHVRKDGSRFWASGLMMRMQGDSEHRLIKVMRNRSAQKQAEEERVRQQARIAVLEERHRMGQELHDTLAQGFTGIAVQLEAALDVVHSESETAEAHIKRASALARESLQEARRAVQALRPGLLQTRDLPAALAHLVEQTTAGTSVSGECVVQGKVRTLLHQAEDDLLRIAQEALTNALRHSGATKVKIELSFGAQAVQLWIQDNGQGFDALASPPEGHFGLQGMCERAQRWGGHLAIRSQPGQGTQLSVVIADAATG